MMIDTSEGIMMKGILTSIRDHNFAAVCYGPSLQGTDLKATYSIATLRSSRVIKDPNHDYTCDTVSFFTPMLHHTCLTGNPLDDGDDGYEEIIVGNFVIPGFTVNRSSNCQ